MARSFKTVLHRAFEQTSIPENAKWQHGNAESLPMTVQLWMTRHDVCYRAGVQRHRLSLQKFVS